MAQLHFEATVGRENISPYFYFSNFHFSFLSRARARAPAIDTNAHRIASEYYAFSKTSTKMLPKWNAMPCSWLVGIKSKWKIGSRGLECNLFVERNQPDIVYRLVNSFAGEQVKRDACEQWNDMGCTRHDTFRLLITPSTQIQNEVDIILLDAIWPSHCIRFEFQIKLRWRINHTLDHSVYFACAGREDIAPPVHINSMQFWVHTKNFKRVPFVEHVCK